MSLWQLPSLLSTVNIYLHILKTYQLCIYSEFMLWNVLISARDWQDDNVVSCYPISGYSQWWRLNLTDFNTIKAEEGLFVRITHSQTRSHQPQHNDHLPSSDQNTRDLIVLTWPENELQMIFSPLPPIIMTALNLVKSWKANEIKANLLTTYTTFIRSI